MVISGGTWNTNFWGNIFLPTNCTNGHEGYAIRKMATGSVALIVSNAMGGYMTTTGTTWDNLKLSFAGATKMPRNIIAHELHEFSCKRVQNRTCSSYAERSRKCQRN